MISIILKCENNLYEIYYLHGDLMDEKICMNDIQINIENDTFIIQRERGFLSLNNLNDDIFSDVKTIINHSVSDDQKILQNPDEYIKKFLKNMDISSRASVMLTNADINQIAIKTCDYVTAVVSASDLNLYGTGELIESENENIVGSLNIILLINKNLNQKSLLNSYLCAERAKMAAIWDLDVRSSSGDLAIGNPNDHLIVACTGKSDEDPDNGLELQTLVMKCIRNATKKAFANSGFSKGVLDFIESVGVKIDDLVNAGMELCVGVEKSEDLYTKLHNQILKSLEDLNVVSFIIAGIRLEEDYEKHRVEGINVDDDPAYLYSDEVFGMSVANQIAGTKAIFNFKRYDEEKPGIIGELGPVLDDIFAGLVAGCMSKIFEE